MAPPYVLETERLYVQALNEEEHIQDYHELWSDRRALVWSSKVPSTSLAQTRLLMAMNLKSPDHPWVEQYAMLLKPEFQPPALPSALPKPAADCSVPEAPRKPKLIGLAGVIRQSLETGEREMGYMLHPDYWGRGLGTEALRAFLQVYWSLDDRKDVDEIIGLVDAQNVASANVLRKVGAKKRPGPPVKGIWPSPQQEGVRFYDVWVMERPRGVQGS